LARCGSRPVGAALAAQQQRAQRKEFQHRHHDAGGEDDDRQIGRTLDPQLDFTPLMMVLSSMSLRLAVRMIGSTLAGMYIRKAAISSAQVRT
jgi:hypothetical protein